MNNKNDAIYLINNFYSDIIKNKYLKKKEKFIINFLNLLYLIYLKFQYNKKLDNNNHI